MRCAVIGLGEAGGSYSAALAAEGHRVIGFDPQDVSTPKGVDRAGTLDAAVREADVILVMTSAKISPVIVQESREHLKAGALYADFTSSSPRTMKELSHIVEDAGASFVDVAILGPVSWSGAKTPLMVSGSAASELAQLVQALGAPVEVVRGPAGAAMGHKLLRSVLMKGLASLVIEAIRAGRAADSEDWIRDQIARQLAGDGHAVIERFLEGTTTHAERRAHEMRAATAYLEDLGVPNEMAEATARALSRIASEKTVL